MQIRVDRYLAVIGTNLECCAYDNPRGEIIGDVHYLLLEDSTGRRWAGPEVSHERGHKIAEALQRSIDKGYDPTTCELFQEIQPAYGSDAYIQQGTDAELVAWEKKFDQEI